MHNPVCSFPGKKKTKRDSAPTKTQLSFLFVLPNIDHLSFHVELPRKFWTAAGFWSSCKLNAKLSSLFLFVCYLLDFLMGLFW